MAFNQIDTHFLIAAICVISSALVFYTIGVWGERLQKQLKASADVDTCHVGFMDLLQGVSPCKGSF